MDYCCLANEHSIKPPPKQFHLSFYTSDILSFQEKSLFPVNNNERKGLLLCRCSALKNTFEQSTEKLEEHCERNVMKNGSAGRHGEGLRKIIS